LGHMEGNGGQCTTDDGARWNLQHKRRPTVYAARAYAHSVSLFSHGPRVWLRGPVTVSMHAMQ
jgi:hypothetical protein